METNRKLEIASFILTILALYLLSIPNINTFIVFIVSMIVQMALFYRTKQVFLFIQMLVIFGWNFYSYWQWTIKGIG